MDAAGLVTVLTLETDPTATLSFSHTVADAEGLVSNAAQVTAAAPKRDRQRGQRVRGLG